MEIILSVVTGLLFTISVYLLLHRSFIKMIVGVIVFAHAINLFLFIAGKITRSMPAFITEEEAGTAALSDPLPQAFILTAIVIGMGVQIFTIVLLNKVHFTAETDDLDTLKTTDLPEA